jgi:hypothetical protein
MEKPRSTWDGGAVPTQPEPAREINLQMAELEAELHTLRKSMEDLALRLEPLLAPATPGDEQPNKQAEPSPLSPLGDTLLKYRRMVRDARKGLQELCGRIAI